MLLEQYNPSTLFYSLTRLLVKFKQKDTNQVPPSDAALIQRKVEEIKNAEKQLKIVEREH